MNGLIKTDEPEGRRWPKYKELKYEILDIFLMGASMMIAQIFITTMGVIVMIFAGRLGTTELDGVGLAISFANISFWAVTAGMASASETLFSQCYGTQNKKNVGVFLQRSIVFFTLASLIVTALNINSDILFILLGQDPVLACIARRFLLLATPGCIAFYTYRLALSYLRVQDVFWPVIVSPAIGTASCWTFAYSFLTLTDFGVDGLALAYSLSFITMALSVLTYVYVTKMYLATWSGWSIAVFENWWLQFKLTIAGVLMTTSEYAFLEIVTLLSGTLDEVTLGAQTILSVIFNISSGIVYGFSIAGAIRVGTSLGANDAYKARRSMYISLALGISTAVVVLAFIATLRYQIVGVFSSDANVIAVGASTLLIVCGEGIVDTFYNIFNGILRGAGRHALASVVNIVCIYGIGVTLLFAIRFATDLANLTVYWLVYTGVIGIIVIIMGFILLRTNWQKQAQAALERVKAGSTSHDRNLNEKNNLILDDETKPLLPSPTMQRLKQKSQWSSFSDIVGQVSRHASQMDLSNRNQQTLMVQKPHPDMKSVVLRKIAIISVTVISVTLIFLLNMTETVSPQVLFGRLPTFINSTNVHTCKHLIWGHGHDE